MEALLPYGGGLLALFVLLWAADKFTGGIVEELGKQLLGRFQTNRPQDVLKPKALRAYTAAVHQNHGRHTMGFRRDDDPIMVEKVYVPVRYQASGERLAIEERLRDADRAVIVGEPGAGKSIRPRRDPAGPLRRGARRHQEPGQAAPQLPDRRHLQRRGVRRRAGGRVRASHRRGRPRRRGAAAAPAASAGERPPGRGALQVPAGEPARPGARPQPDAADHDRLPLRRRGVRRARGTHAALSLGVLRTGDRLSAPPRRGQRARRDHPARPRDQARDPAQGRPAADGPARLRRRERPPGDHPSGAAPGDQEPGRRLQPRRRPGRRPDPRDRRAQPGSTARSPPR